MFFSHCEVSVNEYANILIIARWRSGSTFTGEIFRTRQDTYYVYEPLAQECQKRRTCQDLKYDRFVKYWYNETSNSKLDNVKILKKRAQYLSHVNSTLNEFYSN